MSETRRKNSLPAICSAAMLLGASAGCGDPIYDTVVSMPAEPGLVLVSSEDTSRYEWPLTRDGYVVAKPPQMAYITSFEGKLKVPDPASAPLVPWSSKGLEPRMLPFLDQAYKSVSLDLDVALRLNRSQFAGPHAFDVSYDGSRMVVIDDEGLALYKTDDGSLIGHMPLPREVASAKPAVDAVRFCGKTKDMLVASSERIFRISSKDGSVSAAVKGCGEPIAQWTVTPDDKAMLIRSESGRLFGGDPQLNFFAAYSLGKDERHSVASLSPDGKRIGVVVNNLPRVYVQDDFRIVDETDYTDYTLGPDVSIACGMSSDAWVDGELMFYTQPQFERGVNDFAWYHMYWKPIQVSVAQLSPDRPNENHYLCVGQRFFAGKEQLIMFDFGPIGRNHSRPKRLDEVPIRYCHSNNGNRVAILDSRGLRLCRRTPYHSRSPDIWQLDIFDWMDRGRFEAIEKLLAIIGTQHRLGFGMPAESLRSYIIARMADRWVYLDNNDEKDEKQTAALKTIEKWLAEGSQLALVVSGVRHRDHAWNARGSGTANTVTKEGWEIYGKHLDLAKADFDKAAELGPLPMAALQDRINISLEQNGGLEEVDPWCREATEMYPASIGVHNTIIFKLLPQWFGEHGDCLSFALSVSKMFEGAEGDYKYLLMTGRIIPWLHFQNTVAWASYDSNRIRRGLDEFIRREPTAQHGGLWNLWWQFSERTRDNESADRVLVYAMENIAAPPWAISHGNLRSLYEQVRDRMNEIRSE